MPEPADPQGVPVEIRAYHHRQRQGRLRQMAEHDPSDQTLVTAGQMSVRLDNFQAKVEKYIDEKMPEPVETHLNLDWVLLIWLVILTFLFLVHRHI